MGHFRLRAFSSFKISISNAGTLPSLSEQQLVDCVTADAGCNGGLMDDAFAYVICMLCSLVMLSAYFISVCNAANKGITSEALYPYTAVTGTCKKPLPASVATISSFTDVTPGNELALETAIVQQPISVAVEADQAAWQAYTGGVVTANCGTALGTCFDLATRLFSLNRNSFSRRPRSAGCGLRHGLRRRRLLPGEELLGRRVG